MDIITILNGVVVIVGIPTIIGFFIVIGRKLQILDDLVITTNKIKINLKVVSDFLTRNNAKFNSSELHAYSPLQLTDNGKKFISMIGFEQVFEENKQDFFRCVESENPKLKYDVEIASIKSISILYDKEFMSFLKVFFYNNPTRNMENTAPTLGVYVRDKYLSEHPEIKE